jgi:hypothetical protein
MTCRIVSGNGKFFKSRSGMVTCACGFNRNRDPLEAAISPEAAAVRPPVIQGEIKGSVS